MTHRNVAILAAAGVAAVFSAWMVGKAFDKAPASGASALAVERARREIRMLDDLYKTAVVLVNNTYVQDESSIAAGEWARQVFAAMKEKGWHAARLVDATGHPLNEENKPADAFEAKAVKALLAGESYVDEVEEREGKRFLRAMTLVPAVNQKCILCHPGHKVGDVLGGISYSLAIEE
jgi:sugar phosphate isomerase/epimerase